MALEEELLAVQRRHLRKLRNRAHNAQESEAALKAAIATRQELFQKPRTITVHGLKLGLQKGKGKVTIADEPKAIKRLRKLLGDDAEPFIVCRENLDKTQLPKLDTKQLMHIGCSVIEAGDRVLVKPVDGALDKWLNKILSETSTLENVE